MGKAMAQVVAQLFGTKLRINLVAAFDASGSSLAAARPKLSQRICFVEIAVTVETLRFARDLIVQQLERAWELQPREGWAAAIEPVGKGARLSKTFGLWQSIVDDRACEGH